MFGTYFLSIFPAGLENIVVKTANDAGASSYESGAPKHRACTGREGGWLLLQSP